MVHRRAPKVRSPAADTRCTYVANCLRETACAPFDQRAGARDEPVAVLLQESGTLAELLAGTSRRIVLLADSDIEPETLLLLREAQERASFGVVVATVRDALRATEQAEIYERFDALDNVEWLGSEFDFGRLSKAAGECRRRMLKIDRDEVQAALANGEFVLRYQPKVARNDDGDWETQEAEALLRWQHPQNGLMGPMEFLPEIEAFGLMAEVSELVLYEAAQQLLSWQRNGIELNVCVNLASSQLSNEALADTYAAIVRQAGLDCSRFTFEVVEQDLQDPAAPHLRLLTALRGQGFRICLDDFQVAASSLAAFEQLPFDEIKVQSTALRKAQEDRIAMTVLAAVVGLAHNLGVSVCAAGVEDSSTFAFLKSIECDKMQGFVISEAVIPSIIQRVYAAKESAA